ncbi:MAG: hypothetical protein LBB89_00710 [Treponema sp.]|nr:hypothetical protein [Treponema sp.]
MKKIIYFVLIISLMFAACSDTDNSTDGNNSNNGNNNSVVKTGKVTFFNESSYKIVVHQDAFSGPVLLELSAGESKRADVRISDNYGIGSTFSIEYLYRINDAFDTESGEVITSGIDPNVQINFVVEENKSYTKQIPQPANLEFRNAFIKILNSSSLQCELKHLGTVFKQTGNGNLSVAPGKTGVYKLPLGTEGGIPAEGRLYQNYQAVSTFESTTIPDFTAKNGFIYSFTYNGSSVIKTGEQTIIFK